MRVIIEEHKYAAADVKDVLKGIDALENVEGYVSVNYVGYFYNTDKDVRDCVFILPKVLIMDMVATERLMSSWMQSIKRIGVLPYKKMFRSNHIGI